MYKVLADFSDLQDKEHIYRAGDEFPRPGKSVPQDRLKELSTGANIRGFPLIAQVEEEKPAEPQKPAETGPEEAATAQEEAAMEVLPKKTKTRRRSKKAAE